MGLTWALTMQSHTIVFCERFLKAGFRLPLPPLYFFSISCSEHPNNLWLYHVWHSHFFIVYIPEPIWAMMSSPSTTFCIIFKQLGTREIIDHTNILQKTNQEEVPQGQRTVEQPNPLTQIIINGGSFDAWQTRL